MPITILCTSLRSCVYRSNEGECNAAKTGCACEGQRRVLVPDAPRTETAAALSASSAPIPAGVGEDELKARLDELRDEILSEVSSSYEQEVSTLRAEVVQLRAEIAASVTVQERTNQITSENTQRVNELIDRVLHVVKA